MGGLFLALALVVILGGWRAFKEAPRGGSTLDDDAIRRIEGEGLFVPPHGEALDLDQIREEEEEFWEETWDEPEQF
ncbi:MAG: hypothetical protein WEA09_08005 [Gemmatimonadota bacterium]